MKWSQKLTKIQKILGVTQNYLANKFDVSLVTMNRWLGDKALPRDRHQELIEDLYLELTGQKIVADEVLEKIEQEVTQESRKYKNIINYIFKNPDIYDELILQLTYHSNSIEGSTLTQMDTAAVIFDNVALANKTLTEQLEAKNHQAALNYVFNFVKQENRIDENFILKLHQILMNGIYDDAGNYRNHGVRIVGSNVPTANYLKIPDLIPELIKQINAKAEIFDKLATTHAKFEKIHPFADGNGRVGRLLLVAMLLGNNLAPAIISQQKKRLYYTFLNKAQLKGEHSQLEKFIIQSVLDGFKILKRK